MFQRIGESGRLNSTRLTSWLPGPPVYRWKPMSQPLNSPALKSITARDQVSPSSLLMAKSRGQSLPEPGRLFITTEPSSRCSRRASPTVGSPVPIGTSPPIFQVWPWSSL
jgi:hypothetical protein